VAGRELGEGEPTVNAHRARFSLTVGSPDGTIRAGTDLPRRTVKDERMLPTYWLAGAPEIEKQNNPYTSQTWMAATFGEVPQDTWGVVVTEVSQVELAKPREFEMTPVLLLELLVGQLVDEGAALTDELRAELPRDDDPVPPALLQPSWDAIDVGGHLCLALVAAFGAQRAYITICDGFWLCVLCPAGRRPQLKPVCSPTDVNWQFSADA
jgi:hypothetical protein